MKCIHSRTQVEVVGVTKNDICVNSTGKVLLWHSFDRTCSAYGHEDRRLNGAVIGLHFSGAGCRTRIGGVQREFHCYKGNTPFASFRLYLHVLGTIINVATVITGSSLGLIFSKRLPEKVTEIVFVALGLFTLFIGFTMAGESLQPLVLVLSLLFGAIVGQLLDLDRRLTSILSRLQPKMAGGEHAPERHQDSQRFTEGLLTAFVLFCVGSMTLLGCFREGLTGERDIILTKSFMDFFSSAALAAAYGRGVLFSVIPLFIYQGALTLGASQLQSYLTPELTAEIYGTGGLMLIALGLNLLKVTDIKVLNLTPALLFAPFLARYFPLLQDAILSF